MKRICVISEDQFFTQGLVFLLEGEYQVIPFYPERTLTALELNEFDIIFVYVRDRILHRHLCIILRTVAPKLVFFLKHSIKKTCLEDHFWDTRMSPERIRKRIPALLRIRETCYLDRLTSANQLKIVMASVGLEGYSQLLKAQNMSMAAIHGHHRQLLKLFGIKNVSIHNLYLTEYMSAGLCAASSATPES